MGVARDSECHAYASNWPHDDFTSASAGPSFAFKHKASSRTAQTLPTALDPSPEPSPRPLPVRMNATGPGCAQPDPRGGRGDMRAVLRSLARKRRAAPGFLGRLGAEHAPRPFAWRTNRRRPVPWSTLIPLGGPDANAAGLGVLMRKRRAAPSFLIPLGGPDANAAGLGALSTEAAGCVCVSVSPSPAVPAALRMHARMAHTCLLALRLSPEPLQGAAHASARPRLHNNLVAIPRLTDESAP
jgi:hypothetical protein